jgi:hypothetical protein
MAMTTTNRRKAKPGDLLEIETPKGLAYVQYVGQHPEYGDVIRVLPGFHEHRDSDFNGFIEKPGYLAFYSARASVAQGLSRIVGSYPLGIEVPNNVRRAGARAKTGEILTWIVESDGYEIVRERLSEMEKQLPIAAVWDHELLVMRISQEWMPEKEG